MKAGSNEDFSAIYEESYKYLYTCVIHIVKNEDTAQDMLQETYAEIFKNMDQLKNDQDFLSWAATIANRKCFAYLKKNREVLMETAPGQEDAGDFFEAVPDDEAFIPENIFDNAEKIRMIRDIIDGLTDVQRACVIGFYYNEQKQDEIASELGIPVNTVKSHLNRAKSKIREAVGDVEKKQGVKLYSFAPFMLLLFAYETEVFGKTLSVPAMRSAPEAAAKAGESGSATAGGMAAGTKAGGSLTKIRIVIGVAAAAAVVAAAVGIFIHNKNSSDAAIEEVPAAAVSEAPLVQEESVVNEPAPETVSEEEVAATEPEEAEEIPEEPVPDGEANNVEFVDRIATDNPVWVFFTKKEGDDWYLNPDPDCTCKEAGVFLEVTDVAEKELEDGNKEYKITFTQDVNYTLRYPTSYENLYHFFHLNSLEFYDYYTGRKLNASETSMDVGEMEKEGEIENIIEWDGKEYPVTIRIEKERENRYGDETESDGFYETNCIPFVTFTYTVTCPKDYDGLCGYVRKPESFPADAMERCRREDYDENGKKIEDTDPEGERYLFEYEDPIGGVPTAQDLYMMRF